MRARISGFFFAIMLAACSSGTHTVYVVRERPVLVSPPPAPPPPPAPVVVEPLEVALGRPSVRSVPVQTNRAAYVAIFEITPQEGVTLVHPSTPRQARMPMSGLSSVPVWWESQSSGARGGAARPARPTRYIYALASERPLRLIDSAFVPGYLDRILGPSARRAAAPQPAMRALARHFAPAAISGRWAEDLYTLAPSTETSPRRVARIYCTGGTVYEVPEDIADRAWCPVQGSPAGQPATSPSPARPDSVVGPTGRLVNRRIGDVMGRGLGHQEREAKPDSVQTPPQRTNTTPPVTPVVSNGQPGGREKAEKEKADKDRADKDRADKDRADKDKADKDKADKDKADKDKADRDRAEKEKTEKYQRDQQQSDVDRAARDNAEKERVLKERADKERADNEHAQKEQVERERVEKEKADKDKADKDKADKDKADKDKADKDKADKDKADKTAKEHAEREKAEKERTDREAADSAVAARERIEAENVRMENEKAAHEKAEKEKAENEKAAKAKADTEKAEKEKAEKEKAEKEKAEKEKADKADKLKADNERAEKDKAEKDKAAKSGKAGPPDESAEASAKAEAQDSTGAPDAAAKARQKGKRPGPPKAGPPAP